MSLPPLSLDLSYPDKNVMTVYMGMAAGLGVKRISIDAVTLRKIAEDKELAADIVKAADQHKITVFDAHAPHSMCDSLGCPLPGAFEHSVQTMLTSLQSAAEIGVKVLTMHTARTRLVNGFAPESGPIEYADLDGAADRTLRQLEILIPEAEKLGICIALENLFLPSATAAHLMRIMEKARHANLGFCYDSGHALIVEDFPGKTPEMIAGWIACGWNNDTITFQGDQLDLMLNDVITTHFHDNDGKGDLHLLPGNGIANWKRIAGRMNKAPRLLSVQSEVGKGEMMADIREAFRMFAEAGFPIRNN